MNHSTLPTPPTLMAGQKIHVIGLAILLPPVWAMWRLLGQPSPVLFWIAVSVPVAHQVFVWLAWRLELRARPERGLLSFPAYHSIFFALFGGRFVALLALAWTDSGSLQLGTGLRALLTAPLLVVGAYAMYSVVRYFGLARAAGADHFDSRYRDMPLVKRGIFRFTSNGMYLYAFWLFWAVAVGFNSAAALAVAAFSHVYIWVHYYATEKPDMAYLYRDQTA